MTGLLSVGRVSKRFRGLVAVDNVSFDVPEGTIFAVIGPNGAGKTTLFNLIAGGMTPDQGRIIFDREPIHGFTADEVCRRGIARTFQIVRPFAGLTVHENIAIGAHLSRRSRVAARDAAAQVAQLVGLEALLDKPAASLTVAGRKRLELARALATEPGVLLLDEVLAGLNPTELAAMVPTIRAIAERGITIVMIEHVMQAVMSLAQHVYVLAEGRILTEGSPQEVVGDARVVEAYLGRGAAARLNAVGAAHG